MSKLSSKSASCLNTGGISSLNLYPNAMSIFKSANILTGKPFTKNILAFNIRPDAVGNNKYST